MNEKQDEPQAGDLELDPDAVSDLEPDEDDGEDVRGGAVPQRTHAAYGCSDLRLKEAFEAVPSPLARLRLLELA